MRRFVVACACIVATSLAAPSSANAVDGGMISNAAVAPLGLKVQWFTQVETGAPGQVVDMVLNVNEDDSTTFFDIEFGRGHEVISQHDLDAFGNPRGIEGAQEHAEIRREIIEKELQARGFENTKVTIQKYSLPSSSLYALTSDGLVAAMDADTGSIRWNSEIGDRSNPSIGIGANNNYVAAVNGTTLYCLEAATGKVLFSVKCKSSVSAGPAVSDEFIYVPLLSGRVEVFPIGTRGVGAERYIGAGRALSRPLITEKSVAWTTTAGHLNVALHKNQDASRQNEKSVNGKGEQDKSKSDDKTIKSQQKILDEVNKHILAIEKMSRISYRMSTNDELVSSATSKSGVLFVTSLGGFVYAVDEAKGNILWEFSTGDEIESRPFSIGNFLYVLTVANSLYKLDAQTGALAWENPINGITRFIGASKDRLFVVDRRENLLVLGQEFGQRQGTVSIAGTDLFFANTQSDRLYVGNTNGLIQCLTEVNSNMPYFHNADFEKAITEKPLEEGKPGEMEAGESDDPFRAFDAGGDDKQSGGDDITAEDNPFGGGNAAPTDKMGGDENPFGGGSSDDTKGGSGKDDENPFGGGNSGGADDDNPFGGGGN